MGCCQTLLYYAKRHLKIENMESEIDQSELSTPAEMAKKYRVAVSTFMQWHHEGIFKAAVAIGKIYRFNPDHVQCSIIKHSTNKKI
jgi:hypothetical protein